MVLRSQLTMAVLGQLHPSIAKAYTALGDVSFKLKHYDAGVAMTYFNIAKVDFKLGNHKDAFKKLLKALEIRKILFNKKNLHVMVREKVNGEGYADMGLTKKREHHLELF